MVVSDGRERLSAVTKPATDEDALIGADVWGRPETEAAPAKQDAAKQDAAKAGAAKQEQSDDDGNPCNSRSMGASAGPASL